MPDEAKYFCYTYITPFIFDAAGMTRGQADASVFEKSFTYCAAVPEEENRHVCYAGMGKEFVVLAQNRDIRRIDQMNDEQLQKVIGWCDLAYNEEGVQACLNEAQNSLYWGGENDYGVSVRYCGLLEGSKATGCYENFFENVSFYESSAETKKEICTAIPEVYQSECIATLGIE